MSGSSLLEAGSAQSLPGGVNHGFGITPKEPWDPDTLVTTGRQPSSHTLRRIGNEMKQLLESPLPGIFCVPDDDDAMKLHALITGPTGTPYENGFFWFTLGLPHDYGEVPPKVKLQTTGGGSVRFNPNLYASGKVCLSILGTWAGPGWSGAMKLSSVLLSIQSLLSEAPLRNEPGFEKVTDNARLASYSAVVAHETLRVAVVDNLQRVDSMPPALREAMMASVIEFREGYRETCGRLAPLWDGRAVKDADTLDGFNKGTFAFGAIGKRIDELLDKVEEGELV